jgi:hypothetical protein
MGEASPCGVAPRSPWRARTVTAPATPRAPPSARRAHCPHQPAHDGHGARGARTSPPSSSTTAFLGAEHTFMHTAHQCDPAARASALRRLQQPMARASRAPATQTRTPTRCAARSRRRRASPPPPACFRSFAATTRLTKFRNPPCGFLSHTGGAGISGLGASAPDPKGGRPKKAGTQKCCKNRSTKIYQKKTSILSSSARETACTLAAGGEGRGERRVGCGPSARCASSQAGGRSAGARRAGGIRAREWRDHPRPGDGRRGCLYGLI